MSIYGHSKHNMKSIRLHPENRTKSTKDKTLQTYLVFVEFFSKQRALLCFGKQGALKHVTFTYLEV